MKHVLALSLILGSLALVAAPSHARDRDRDRDRMDIGECGSTPGAVEDKGVFATNDDGESKLNTVNVSFPLAIRYIKITPVRGGMGIKNLVGITTRGQATGDLAQQRLLPLRFSTTICIPPYMDIANFQIFTNANVENGRYKVELGYFNPFRR